MTNPIPPNWVPTGGTARIYRNVLTGAELSRRQFDKLFGRFAGKAVTPESQAAERAAPRETTREKVGRVVQRIRDTGQSPSRAARAEHISPETVRRYDRDRGVIRYNRRERRGEVHKAGTVTIIDATGAVHKDVDFDHKELSTVGAYYGALGMAQSPNPGVAARGKKALASFKGTTVHDVYGRQYTLMTDVDAYNAKSDELGYDPIDFFTSGDEPIAPSAAAQAA